MEEKQDKKTGFGITGMRAWDMLLLERYGPRYYCVNKTCALCALGPCNLEQGRKGACGQDQEVFAAREALLMSVTGASAHAAHADDIVRRAIAEKGPEFPLDLGEWVHIRMPLTRIVTGLNPHCLADILQVLEYINSRIVRLIAAAHFGGESHLLDLESKTMHAGTMDILAMEVADVAQISVYNFPRGESHAPLKRIGIEDSSDRPFILCVGHNAEVGYRLVQKADREGLSSSVAIAGLCCTAHDMVRGCAGKDNGESTGNGPMIAGNMRDQFRFIRSGRADVVIIDQQCIRLDIVREVLLTGAYLIATSDQTCAGLPDETACDTEMLVSRLSEQQVRAVYISDPDKAARLALALALRKGRETKPSARPSVASEEGTDLAQRWQAAARCVSCGLCSEHCPISLPVAEVLSSAGEAVRKASEGGKSSDIASLADALGEHGNRCLGCGRCNTACPQNIPVMDLLKNDAQKEFPSGWIRIGRGAIDDYEIKSTGPSLVLGDIPGVVAFLTCPEYPDGRGSAAWMARILAERKYIVLAAGCAAMDLGLGEDSLYRRFPGDFDMGGIVNTGSCVSSAHALGALVKVAAIFLHRKLDGNYAEIADYILNRIGAVGLLWGGITPKSFSASAGANRLGVPVIYGPQGRMFRRTLEGSAAVSGVIDARSGREVNTGRAPVHLSVIAGTKEEALIQTARLCLRPNDTTWGRQIKLRNYIELSELFSGTAPTDLIHHVRVPEDIPEERRESTMELIRAAGWEPSFIPDPTLLRELVREGYETCRP
ncbi:MAG: acetyl-CoA decarbonylase/synthase complex subunit alpha [Nitrospirae bacterium]|nr:acetyl-CoA decarbonylase/synthase complex subunit alpha [Nitrospirota bacterium]MCL5238611.1 acetyl-CoA decarbonylase/synthase complex subunit alpha [Nitrospirota bacterium]